jgi:predicted anti-sigma-YlaC factor YlaD
MPHMNRSPVSAVRTDAILAVSLILVSLLASGCSIRKMAVNALAESLSRSSIVYERDDDPELVADALPFMLKTMEGLLEETPKNKTLLLNAAKGFTSYAQAFVAVPADYIEENDLDAARNQRARASRLFLRGREFALRGLELDHKDIRAGLAQNPDSTLQDMEKKDVPLLFWSGAAWAGAINVRKDDMDLVADFNIANALLQCAFALDPAWNDGAIHEVLIALEAARSGGYGGSLEAARDHFKAAVKISHGETAGPYVALAEAVSVKEQNVTEFRSLLEQALAVDVEAAPDQRLANTLAQRRARWLLAHTADYFIDYDENEDSP